MTGSAMDGGASGRRLWRHKTGKTATEWQLPVSGLASAVADVLSGGETGTNVGYRLGRHRWLLCWLRGEKLIRGCGVYTDYKGWLGLVQNLMGQILER
nr:hypothetical protein CFP56_17950 [Quercus suber]